MSTTQQRFYETLLLAKTEITEDEQETMRKEFESIFSKASGNITTFDRWGKYRLSYPVQKSEYGIYILMRYEIAPDKATEAFKSFDTYLKIKCNDFIMRWVTMTLGSNPPAHYEKPDSLDATGKSSDIDTLIKDNNIEELLSSVDASSDKEVIDQTQQNSVEKEPESLASQETPDTTSNNHDGSAEA